MTAILIRAREPRDVEAIAEILSCPGVVAGTLQLPYQSVEARRASMAQPASDTIAPRSETRAWRPPAGGLPASL